MKKNKKTRSNEGRNGKKVFWIFLVFCAAVMATTTFLLVQQDLKKAKKQITENSMEKEIAERVKKEAEEKEKAENEQKSEKAEKKEEGPKKQVQFEQAGPAPKNIVGFVNFKEFVDSQLTINVVIRQLLETAGTCTLSMSSVSGQKIDDITVKTGDDPSTSYCQTFKIPREKLSAGKWKIKINVTAGNQTGVIEDEVIL